MCAATGAVWMCGTKQSEICCQLGMGTLLMLVLGDLADRLGSPGSRYADSSEVVYEEAW